MIGCTSIPVPSSPPATLPSLTDVMSPARDAVINNAINYTDPHVLAVGVGLILIALALPQFKLSWYYNLAIAAVGVGLVFIGVR